ncbi:nucleoside hydrolase-like domain-containing protein [Sphingomonas sp. Sphisp140]|uniref:DUF1593 domain-containing protein n=1 Tax=unclassified Sphingomonas TaxID=196159 RepID=UPI0039B0A5FB
MLPFALLLLSAQAVPVPPPERPRVIVLSDIGNEPDDSESLVRFLLYSDCFDVEGLVASTSVWQRDKAQPQLMRVRIDAYEKVRPKLLRHSPTYPTADALRAVLRSGQPSYGMAGVGKGKDSEASKLIVRAVDRADKRPVWVLLWGGAVDLAQALWHVRATRSPAQVQAFLTKLRVYSISDQDDAGPWARRNFPSLFWIASIHGWGQYNMATWAGISGDRRNAEQWPDRETVGDAWLEANIRRGPLGALYPLPEFIMEGDTPSFLYLIPNGLNDPERPDFGGWGGRYMHAAPSGGLFADVKDSFARDGRTWSGNQASVYRWRAAFQNDFAARMAWSVDGRANHAPVVVAQGVAGLAPVRIRAKAGETVTLDAAGTRDPDGDALDYRWWQYREVGGIPGQSAVEIADAGAPRASFVAPSVKAQTALHLILEVRDRGAPPITRYRRVIVEVSPQ